MPEFRREMRLRFEIDIDERYRLHAFVHDHKLETISISDREGDLAEDMVFKDLQSVLSALKRLETELMSIGVPRSVIE